MHLIAREGKEQGVNAGPPQMGFGNLLGGWLTRPGETKPRSKDQIILFAKYTTLPGKRAPFNKVLYDGMAGIDKNEPGCLTILLIEDDQDEDVTFVMERFENEAALDAHMNGPAAAKVGPLVKEFVKSREGGKFKELTGFLSKDE
jgi:quinol monooxygenase YgiN